MIKPPKSQIIIDVQNSGTAVALLEEGRLAEFYVEISNAPMTTGNIYKGRAQNVLSGMQSAFIDIGLERNGFLSVVETISDKRDIQLSALPTTLDIKSGDYIMVQVTKEETGQKGVRLTQYVTLPGKFVVLMPTTDFLGVSNRITDETARERLLALLSKHKPQGGGVIARTAAENADKKEIIAEIKRLNAEYQRILAQYENTQGAGLVYSEGDLVVRTVRDLCHSNVERIICAESETLESIRARLEPLGLTPELTLFDDGYDILGRFGLLDELDRLLERRVELENGGSIVFDFTEALTAVDVNSAGFSGIENRETSVLEINLAAADEIARQLRLRNIGGIIVVDFIDMLLLENRQRVSERFIAALKNDRAKTRVAPLNEMGVLTLTRKKMRQDLASVLLENCPYCRGDGRTYSAVYMVRKIRAELISLFGAAQYSNALVYLNPHTVTSIMASRTLINEVRGTFKDKRIYIIADERLNPKRFRITVNNAAVLTLPNSAVLL